MRCRPPTAARRAPRRALACASRARRSRASPASPTSLSPCRAWAAARSRCSAPRTSARDLSAGGGRRAARSPPSRCRSPTRARTSRRLRRRREPDGAGFVLNGAKTWISNGGIADFYVVFARTGEAPGARGLSAFIVDADTPGSRDRRADRGDRAAPAGDAAVRRLPRTRATQLLGEPGQGFKVAHGDARRLPPDGRRRGARLRAPRARRGARARAAAASCSAGRWPSCS